MRKPLCTYKTKTNAAERNTHPFNLMSQRGEKGTKGEREGREEDSKRLKFPIS